MEKIIKDHWKKFILILIFPFILDWILRFIWWIDIPIKENASAGEWLGFLGAYFGVIGAIGGIWWQLNEEKRKTELGYLILLKCFIKDLQKDEYFDKKIKYLFDYLPIAVGVSENTDYLLISSSRINLLKNNFTKISHLDIGLVIFKIIESLEFIENQFTLIKAQSLKIRLRFNEIFSEIFKLSDELIKKDFFYLKYRLSSENYRNSILNDLQNNVSIRSLDNLRFSSEEKTKLESISTIKQLTELNQAVTDLITLSNKVFSINNKNEFISYDLIDFAHFLEEIGSVLFDAPSPLYNHTKLKEQFEEIIPELEKEIKKLS